MRPSDEILEMLNRLNTTKLTGVKGSYDFRNLLIKISNLGVNAFKLGKMTKEDAESFQSAYADKDYIGKHNKELAVAQATVKQSFEMAGYELDKKNITVKQQKEERQYIKTAA